jgi:hypothetical protein
MSTTSTGFADQLGRGVRWLESDISTSSPRSPPSRIKVTAARPFHLNAFRLRNGVVIMDYGSE